MADETKDAAADDAGEQFPLPAGVADRAIRKITRRGFLSSVTFGWLFFVGAISSMSLAVLRFIYPNVLYEPPMRFKVGPPDDYPHNSVETKWKEKYGVWIARSDEPGIDGGLYALISVCTHLGCPPNWQSSEYKFKCPCHGSGFRISGVNFEGPAPRPLERAYIKIDPDDGQLVVDKSIKFQRELGQWESPDSRIPLSDLA